MHTRRTVHTRGEEGDDDDDDDDDDGSVPHDVDDARSDADAMPRSSPDR
jgi:hypothetical protein